MAPRKSPPDNRRDDSGFKAAAKVVEDYVQELERARTVSKQAADAQEALRKALDGLKEAFPAVGGLITAFKSPLTGVVEVGRYLITSTIEGIKKMMDSIGEDVSFGKLTEVFRQQKRAIEDAGTSAKLYAKRLSDIGQATDTPTDAAEKNIEALQKQKAVQDQLAKEQLRADRAKISLEEINPIERDRKLKLAEESFAREKAARDKAVVQDELKVRREALEAEQKLATEQAAKLAADREKMNRRLTPATMDNIDNADRENLKNTEALMAKKQARYEELKDKGWLRRSTPEQTEMNYLGEEIEGMEGVRAALQKKIRANERVFGKRRQEYAVGQADISKGEQDLLATTERINQDKRRLAAREEETRRAASADAQIAKIAAQADKDEATKAKNDAKQPEHYQIGRTELESKGFVLNGFAVTDNSALKTADNTTIMVTQLMTLIDLQGVKTHDTTTNDHAN